MIWHDGLKAVTAAAFFSNPLPRMLASPAPQTIARAACPAARA